MKYLRITLTAIAGLIPTLVTAQGNIQPVPVPPNANIAIILVTVLNWAFGLLIVLAALFIMWAAFLYLTSSGDSEKTEKATRTIVFAVIAVVVAALSRAIVFIVQQILSTGTGF